MAWAGGAAARGRRHESPVHPGSRQSGAYTTFYSNVYDLEAGEGQVRRWPDEIAMRREIVERVTRRWGEYGLRS